MASDSRQSAADEWIGFPGGELEGKRPKALCPACREALNREAAASRRRPQASPSAATRTKPLCFQCYRADLDRERAIGLAGELDTGSEQRFQYLLPLEPINHARLRALKAERAEARTHAVQGIGAYIDKRRHAQIAARRALQSIADGLRARRLAPDFHSDMLAAIHAAELQLPESWLPFVVAR